MPLLNEGTLVSRPVVADKLNNMNREELKIKLEELNIPDFWYSLDGEVIPNRRILQKGGGQKGYWLVYGIDERGNKSDFIEFCKEDEACEYFYKMMRKNKEREEKIKNMSPYIPFQKKERTFIVSEKGEANVQKENQIIRNSHL